MAIPILSSTTLGAAVSASDNKLTVASTTGITAGMQLVCRGEAMRVVSVDSTTQLTVRRGTGGTTARAHPNPGTWASTATVYYATGDKWEALNKSAPGFLGPEFPFPVPGARATDGQGNVYILVELTETTCPHNTVAIASDYTAATLASGAQGPVGVLFDGGTSDQYVWAQIYGFCYAFDSTGTSAATSAYFAQAATSVSSPAIGLSAVAASTTDQFLIQGMYITGAATTENAPTGYSSDTSTAAINAWVGTQIPVFLNYPHVLPVKAAIVTSN